MSFRSGSNDENITQKSSSPLSREYRRPVRRVRDVGFMSWGGKSFWLRFKPIPMMLQDIFAPEREFSISIPQIFLFPTYMSLGHLILASIPSFARNPCTARVERRLMSNCEVTGSAAREPLPLRTIEKVRLSPGEECHTFPLWPRPEYCSTAAMTDKSARLSMRLAASLLVESSESCHKICIFLSIGSFFVYICKTNLQTFV